MTREEGIAYLTNDGADDHLLCFSSHGNTVRDCAPVAWRLAYVIQRATEGGAPDTELLDHCMSMVVNDHDDVRSIIRAHGGRKYR